MMKTVQVIGLAMVVMVLMASPVLAQAPHETKFSPGRGWVQGWARP